MGADDLKRAAAHAALSYLVDGAVLGVGSGSTVACFIDALAARRSSIAGAVSSSERSTRLLRDAGIDVLDLNDVGEVPVYVDGADEIDPQLRMIKGGGGALTREKIIAAAAVTFVCIADRGKQVARLGRFPLPVEVIPMARELVARRLATLGARPQWRQGLITDNGNAIVDAHGLSIDDPVALEAEINQWPGVVTVGLFARRGADVALIAAEDGVTTLRR